MIKGTTKSGFAFEVDEKLVANIETLEALSELEDQNLLALPRLVKAMFSKEDKKRLYKHCNNSTEAVIKEIFEIFGYNGETKNS